MGTTKKFPAVPPVSNSFRWDWK